MKIIVFIKGFWLDFFATYHNRLMKNASYETPTSTLLHLSFTQAVNFNTISSLILHFLFKIKLSFVLLFSPIVLFAILNCYFFYKVLTREERLKIIERKPKYKITVYSIYDIISTVLLMLSMFIISKFR